jgi:AraC family transcriptional regulator of adaptative response/methylated-DNA-[protein]-cysteine methyltransferase
MNATLSIAEMQRASHRRDAAYNGLFIVAVRTTGIFCRPTCPARKPLPKNVEYFPTVQAALASGYRPCKRCRPLAWDDQPEWAARLLADVERDPSTRIAEGDLRARGVDPATVRRYFQRRYGMTFQAYARARRLSGALTQIRDRAPLEHAAQDSGFESLSGFRDAFVRTFGQPPGRARTGASIQVSWMSSPLGPLVAGATERGVCLLEFTDRRMLEAQVRTVQRLFAAPIIPGTNDHLRSLKRELAEYFTGALHGFTVPLEYPGTEFQRRVWDALLQIPYGATRSYEQLARTVGNLRAVRAVGRANGLNRIAIVIPCHRVVNKSGQLGGYGGGLRRKEWLLNLERTHAAIR